MAMPTSVTMNATPKPISAKAMSRVDMSTMSADEDPGDGGEEQQFDRLEDLTAARLVRARLAHEWDSVSGLTRPLSSAPHLSENPPMTSSTATMAA